MDLKEALDFNCPQFVDFEASNTPKDDDLFFDCRQVQTPQQNSASKDAPEGVLTEEAENRLLDVMNSACSIITNTPKIRRPVKSRLLSENYPIDKDARVTKAAVKPVTAPRMHARLLRSKSLAHLNKIITGKTIEKKDCGLRKRSSSLGDLKPSKKQTYPRTPMCLKRTIVNSKSKVIKTTEERELEEIARLQQQLVRHLRHNEMHLKKLKLNPRPCLVPKAPPKAENKGLNAAMKEMRIADSKEVRPDIQRIRKTAMKLDSIINRQPAAASINSNPSVSLKNTTLSSASGKKEYSRNVATKEPVSNKKVVPHSGLMFHPSFKKIAAVNPFVVNPVTRVKKSESADVSANVSAISFKTDDGKENIYEAKLQTSMKRGKMQNAKNESKNITASGKKVTGRQPVNHPSRGLPLSENIMRH